MLPPPDIFDPARTHCPSCNATLNALTESCAFCGFNAQISIQRYPFTPPALARFVDPDDCITNGESKAMKKAITSIESRFPQITVSVCVMALPENVDGREFGYWYLNRSEVTDEDERRRRLHHLLLIVDRTSNTVSVTVGYGLDCFLDDQFLFRTLNQTSQVFSTKGYSQGIVAWLKLISRELLNVQKDAKFAVERWRRHHQFSSEGAIEQARTVVSEGYAEVVDPAIAVKPQPRSSNQTLYPDSR